MMPATDDAVARYRAATEANDIDALINTLAPDADLVSPISGGMVFRGQDDLRVLLTAVYGALDDLHWDDEIGTGDDVRVITGEARIAGVRLTDATVLHLTPDGRIGRIRPHLRPWLATTLLAIRLLPMIARRPRLARQAIRTGSASTP